MTRTAANPIDHKKIIDSKKSIINVNCQTKKAQKPANHVERQGRIYVFNLSSAACDKLILRAVIVLRTIKFTTLRPLV